MNDRRQSVVSEISNDLEAQFQPTNDRPYVAGPPQRDVIIEENFQTVLDVRIHERYQKKKWFYFTCCTLSNFAGIMLMLYSLAVTNEFADKNGEINYAYLGVSCCLFIPFVIWIRVTFFPGKEERQRRYQILSRRRKRVALEQMRRDVFNGDIEEDADEEEKVDAYGMRIDSNGERVAQTKPGKGGALARAGAAALAKKSDTSSSGSKRPSFLEHAKSKIDGSKEQQSTAALVPVVTKKEKEVVLSARDKLLMELKIPKVGGLRLNEVNRNDPAVLAIVMPNKAKAHTRVMPEVRDPWDATRLVNKIKMKEDDVPYYAAITVLSEQRKQKQSHYLIEEVDVVVPTLNPELAQQSFSGKIKKSNNNSNTVSLPPIVRESRASRSSIGGMERQSSFSGGRKKRGVVGAAGNKRVSFTGGI